MAEAIAREELKTKYQNIGAFSGRCFEDRSLICSGVGAIREGFSSEKGRRHPLPKFVFKDRFAAGLESVIHVTDRGAQFLSLTENRIFVI